MKKCIVCGDKLYNKEYGLCQNCWKKTISKFEEKKYCYYTEHDLITHYHNIFCKAKQEKDTAELETKLIKMISLAIIQYQRYDNKDIWNNKLYKDILLLKGQQTHKTKQIFEEKFINDYYAIEFPFKKENKRFIAEDGHIVRSENEQKIDNMLYHAQIPHAYEKQVDEINERNIYCDWYIPVIEDTGVYIELWSNFSNKYKQKEYEENKKLKINLYNKKKLKLAQFDSTDYPDDQHLQIDLIQKVNEKIKEILDEKTKGITKKITDNQKESLKTTKWKKCNNKKNYWYTTQKGPWSN